PGWPAGSVPNGVVTYTSVIVPALQKLGVTCFIITPVIGKSHDVEPFVIHVPAGSGRTSILQRATDKLMYKLAPDRWAGRNSAAAIAATVEKLRRDQGVELLEMEESYGWPRFVVAQTGVPVLVR